MLKEEDFSAPWVGGACPRWLLAWEWLLNSQWPRWWEQMPGAWTPSYKAPTLFMGVLSQDMKDRLWDGVSSTFRAAKGGLCHFNWRVLRRQNITLDQEGVLHTKAEEVCLVFRCNPRGDCAFSSLAEVRPHSLSGLATPKRISVFSF